MEQAETFFLSRCLVKFLNKLFRSGWKVKELQIHPLVFEQLHEEMYAVTPQDLERYLSVKVSIKKEVGIRAKISSFPFRDTFSLLEEPPTSTEQLVQTLLRRDDVKRLFTPNRA